MNKEKFEEILKKANDLRYIQSQVGNYNYDAYMHGLYNGMEMIIALFEEREPNFIDGKDIDFIHDYKKQLDAIKFYIEQSNIKDMLWGKEILKIIGENNG